MPSAMCQPKLAFVVVAAFMSLLLLVELASPPDSVGQLSSRLHFLNSAARIDPQLSEMNSTLGFQKIFAINLPERSDKRDAMALAAGLSNLSVDYLDGVKGETVPNKALPQLQEGRTWPENILGSWRAHMNAIRTVVEEGMGSALILEDDSDWDIRIKQQLANFAVGSRWLQGTDPRAETRSPYGDDWDVLWLGHCVDAIDERDQRTFVIEDDPSAPDYRELYHPMDQPADFIQTVPPHSRIVHPTGEAICTFAYAVSQRGAQRILYSLAVKELQGFFDNALAWMCRDQPLGAKCMSAYPSYFHQHRAAGMAGKNSDNQDSTPELTLARTDELQWPVKMNYEKLLKGETDFADQYPPKPKGR